MSTSKTWSPLAMFSPERLLKAASSSLQVFGGFFLFPHMEEMLFYEDKHRVQVCFGGRNSCWVGSGSSSTMRASSCSASIPRRHHLLLIVVLSSVQCRGIISPAGQTKTLHINLAHLPHLSFPFCFCLHGVKCWMFLALGLAAAWVSESAGCNRETSKPLLSGWHTKRCMQMTWSVCLSSPLATMVDHFTWSSDFGSIYSRRWLMRE